jgi:hypothetical protein
VCWTPGVAEDIACLDAQQREHASGQIVVLITTRTVVIGVGVEKLTAITGVSNLEDNELRPSTAPIHGRTFGHRVLQRIQQQFAVGEFEDNIGAVPSEQDFGDVAQFLLREVGWGRTFST